MSVNPGQDTAESNEVNNSLTRSRQNHTSVNNERRQSLIRAVCDNGMTIKDAAETLGIKYANARKIICAFKMSGRILKNPKGGKEKSILTPSIYENIEEIISAEHSLTPNIIDGF